MKKKSTNCVAIYHCVYESEGYSKSARTLLELVRAAEVKAPGKRRLLYLDIDGHRNSEGGYDDTMFELQKFVIDTLMPFLAEAHMPLGTIHNPKPQKNDIPAEMPV